MNETFMPLEALKGLINCITDIKFQQRDIVDIVLDIEKYSKIIEIALKDYEQIKDEKILLSAVRDLPNLKKKLEVLEIIKEKQPDIYYVVKSKDYEDYLRVEGMFINMNRALTQEEYDLLKEVLL